MSNQKRELQINLTDCKKLLKEVEEENTVFDTTIIDLNREKEQLQREVKYLDCSITESRIKADDLKIKQGQNIDLLETMEVDYERAILKLMRMEGAWKELKAENDILRKHLEDYEGSLEV